MKNIFISLLCLALFLNVNGQSVTGNIIDKQTGEALIGVNIITQNNQGAATDYLGNYKISLNSGEHMLTFKYIGYNQLSKNISLKKNETIVLNISL